MRVSMPGSQTMHIFFSKTLSMPGSKILHIYISKFLSTEVFTMDSLRAEFTLLTSLFPKIFSLGLSLGYIVYLMSLMKRLFISNLLASEISLVGSFVSVVLPPDIPFDQSFQAGIFLQDLEFLDIARLLLEVICLVFMLGSLRAYNFLPISLLTERYLGWICHRGTSFSKCFS